MAKQYFLIDGYNFLHAAGMVPQHVGQNTLERSRKQLFHYLKRVMNPQERSRTTIVFDVHRFKNAIARKFEQDQMQIINAVDYPDADSCIEELIKKHSSPKQLLVISGDHRLHRAAKARKATPIDSDDFFTHLENRYLQKASPATKAIKLKKEALGEDFEYPAEDLPENVSSSSKSSVSQEEIEHWEKRINQLFKDPDSGANY